MILRSIYAYGEGDGCYVAYNIQKTAKNSNFQPKIHFWSQKLPLNLINGANIDIFRKMHHALLSQGNFLEFKVEIAFYEAQKYPYWFWNVKYR